MAALENSMQHGYLGGSLESINRFPWPASAMCTSCANMRHRHPGSPWPSRRRSERPKRSLLVGTHQPTLLCPAQAYAPSASGGAEGEGRRAQEEEDVADRPAGAESSLLGTGGERFCEGGESERQRGPRREHQCAAERNVLMGWWS